MPLTVRALFIPKDSNVVQFEIVSLATDMYGTVRPLDRFEIMIESEIKSFNLYKQHRHGCIYKEDA